MLTINQYFEGRVASIGLQTSSLPATIGVMTPGEYTFNTEKKEYITIVSGALSVKLPGSDKWQTFEEQETFIVDAGASFDLKVESDTAYLCKYE